MQVPSRHSLNSLKTVSGGSESQNTDSFDLKDPKWLALVIVGSVVSIVCLGLTVIICRLKKPSEYEQTATTDQERSELGHVRGTHLQTSSIEIREQEYSQSEGPRKDEASRRLRHETVSTNSDLPVQEHLLRSQRTIPSSPSTTVEIIGLYFISS